MGKPTASGWVTGQSTVLTRRASTGLVNAVGKIVGAIPGVSDVLVLHRESRTSKFFVVMERMSIETIEAVAQTMVQLEEAFSDAQFDYDTLSEERRAFIPSGAKSIVHAALA